MVKPRSPRNDASKAKDAHPGDDASMFRAAVSDVKPMPQTARAADLRRPPKPRRIEPRGSDFRDLAELMPLLPDSAASTDAVAGADALSFQRPGVRTQVMRRLRRGLYPIENNLDLHGLGQAEARDQLAEFIESNRNAGRRCVRIVHGKGYRSGARGPVLKVAVNTWLKRHGDVMAFTSARAIDGGTGAVYVLLRA